MLTKSQRVKIAEIERRLKDTRSELYDSDIDTLLEYVKQLQEDAEAYERNLHDWLDDAADY